MSDRSARSFSRTVKSSQRLVHQMAFKVDGTGTASLVSGAKDATFVDNGAGDYTITFKQAFRQTPIAVYGSKTTGVLCETAAISTTALQINCYDVATGATLTDGDFDVLVMGSDAEDEIV